MSQTTRRAGWYVLFAAGVMVAYGVVYQRAMVAFEGVRPTYVESLHVVVETFTTTGYGEQAAQWESDSLLLLTMAMQLSGVTMVFLALPVFVVPFIKEALADDPPTATDHADHVVICRLTPRSDTLIHELDDRGVPYVVIEPDRERALSLYADGYDVLHGDPESVDAMTAANVGAATALVVDADDAVTATVILSAREITSDLRIVSVIDDESVADYHRYAGADEVVSPRRLLGESLANKATTSISAELGDAVEVGPDFEIVELVVQQGSPVEGRTVAESGVDDLPGTNVIGAWFRDEFASPPDPEDVIDRRTVLLVAGPKAQLERLKQLARSETRSHRRGSVIVAGHGVVGATVADALASAGVSPTVIDRESTPGADVVGDVTDRRTLDAADVGEARCVILALDDDTTAIFAALVVQQVAPDVKVIVRANATESVPKLYRAGAEYVLSLATVTGRLLASRLLDEEVRTPQTQIELVRTTAPRLVGRSLAEADVRARTDCTVIAVERDGEVLTQVGPEFVVRDGDALVVAGSDDAVARFDDLAG